MFTFMISIQQRQILRLLPRLIAH